MIDQIKTRFAKVEVLETFWDKLYGKMMIQACKKNDHLAKELLR